ncbi:MAG: glucose-6-phosphate dehydrogenase [Acidobacteriota bacterium]
MAVTIENPLTQGLRLERSAQPCVVVVFGASGDLTRRKLVPALYSLFQQGLLSSGFSILGSARTQMSQDAFRDYLREAVEEFSDEGPVDSIMWKEFASGLFYSASDSSDPQSYDELKQLLEQIDQERATSGNRLFYLSTPPRAYMEITRLLNEKGLNISANGGWVRIVVEKPFGTDLESARELNAHLLNIFDEEQVYRIDHYLGKETVQNIMVLRFANAIFEPLWDRQHIDHVQITAAESVGVEGRGGYYEKSGALRDMIQNHLLQVFSLVAMEPPVSMDADRVRDEKSKVMRAVRPIPPKQVAEYAIRAQYGPGFVEGEKSVAYRQEDGVKPDSGTETYAALKLFIDNWRWAEVPFYLRSGKRLPKRVSEIAIQFKQAPHLIFKEAGELKFEGGANALVIRVQPDEGISLKFRSKIPGQAFNLRPVNMDFRYGTSFGRRSPEAYERLLLDAMLGDQTLFARNDMVELCWKLLMPVLEAWKGDGQIPVYESGSWGPVEADALLEAAGRRWRRP